MYVMLCKFFFLKGVGGGGVNNAFYSTNNVKYKTSKMLTIYTPINYGKPIHATAR